MGFTWASQEFFLLLIPWLLAAAVLFFFVFKRRPTVRFSGLAVFKGLGTGWRSRLTHLPLILKWLSLVFVVIAIARPQESSTKVKKNVEGIDIMITLDVSDSMLIEDMNPDRITAAKGTIKEFIKGRGSDRIGFVIFSGEAYTKVPLTLDYKMLLDAVEATEPTRNIKMGTAIGVALANAVGRIKDSTAKTRVVILLTDGENNSGTIAPETALEIAKGYGIRVYTIGIGQDGQAQLPVYQTDMFGRKVKTYQPIHSKVNDELLQMMAEQTGGKYWRATQTKGLAQVFSEINRLEKSKIDVNKFTRYTERFPWFLTIALVLMISGMVLSRTVLRSLP